MSSVYTKHLSQLLVEADHGFERKILEVLSSSSNTEEKWYRHHSMHAATFVLPSLLQNSSISCVSLFAS
jgi:hypothetical protein